MFGSELTAGINRELDKTKMKCEILAIGLGYKIIVDIAGNSWLNKGATCEKVIGWYTLEQNLRTELTKK